MTLLSRGRGWTVIRDAGELEGEGEGGQSKGGGDEGGNDAGGGEQGDERGAVGTMFWFCV